MAAKVLLRDMEADTSHPPGKKVQLVRRLEESSRAASRLLADLLDLDGLTRGLTEPELRRTDLAPLVRRVAEEMASESERPLHLDLHPVVASVDVSKVERILQHLLSNADRYAPPDTPIRVMVRPEGQGALVGVDDAGPGVPSDLRESIFDPFTRGGDDRRLRVGIGLSLVARFAELHGGRAWVQDRPGGGAAFRVFLPSAPRADGPG